MTKEKIEYTSIFNRDLLDKIPMYYRFMSKLSKAELERIEFGDFKTSTSALHRSSTYFLYEPYKPFTKFNTTKAMH